MTLFMPAYFTRWF